MIRRHYELSSTPVAPCDQRVPVRNSVFAEQSVVPLVWLSRLFLLQQGDIARFESVSLHLNNYNVHSITSFPRKIASYVLGTLTIDNSSSSSANHTTERILGAEEFQFSCSRSSFSGHLNFLPLYMVSLFILLIIKPR